MNQNKFEDACRAAWDSVYHCWSWGNEKDGPHGVFYRKFVRAIVEAKKISDAVIDDARRTAWHLNPYSWGQLSEANKESYRIQARTIKQVMR